MIKLPKPLATEGVWYPNGTDKPGVVGDCYTPDQMLQFRRDALEEAASAPTLYDFHAVAHHTSFGRTRIYQLIDDPEFKFPQPIKVGKSSRWLKSEIDSWIAKQASLRTTEN